MEGIVGILGFIGIAIYATRLVRQHLIRRDARELANKWPEVCPDARSRMLRAERLQAKSVFVSLFGAATILPGVMIGRRIEFVYGSLLVMAIGVLMWGTGEAAKTYWYLKGLRRRQ